MGAGAEKPLRALEADAVMAPDGAMVELATDEGDGKLLVPPPGRWKTRATKSLAQGDFDTWAETVLSEEDFDRWKELDPTIDDCEKFFKEWKHITGESRGKSRASQRS